MNTLLYRFVVPLTFVFAFLGIIMTMPGVIGQCIMYGIAGWCIGGLASDFGRWLRDKMNT